MDEGNSVLVGGSAKSENNVFPRKSQVLVKMAFDYNSMGIMALYESDAKFKHDRTEIKYYVAGFGNEVTDLKIGDQVIISIPPKVKVQVNNNHNSIDVIGKALKDLPKKDFDETIIKGTRYQICDYGIFDSYDILATIK